MNMPGSAKELFAAGKLDAAVVVATEDVRQHPTDVQRRLFLAELFCFQGDIVRADKQLDVIVHQHADAVLVLQFRQVLRGEKHREECHTHGRPPDFLSNPPAHLQLLLKAQLHCREGDETAALAAVEEAESARPDISGVCDGQPFAGVRDLADLSASFFEVVTGNGSYYWVPFESVERIQFHAPVAPRDLIWRRASLTVRDGPDGEVFLPALYFGTSKASDDSLRLGRGTAWVDEGGPVRGIGQKAYLIGDEDRPVMTIRSLEIRPSQDR